MLDFAYRVHSNIGDHCTGAKINDKVVTFRHILKNGDQVEIMTSANQKPKQEWLNIVKTSRAKAKVRMALKDMMVKDGVHAKEMFERRLKNRKIEFDESTVSHLIKKLGFKEANDFYRRMADGTLDVNDVIEKYQEILQHDNNALPQQPTRSAEGFNYENPNEEPGPFKRRRAGDRPQPERRGLLAGKMLPPDIRRRRVRLRDRERRNKDTQKGLPQRT